MFEANDEVKPYKLKIIPQAEQDLDDLRGFYDDCAGLESALKFLGAAEAMLNSLTFWPRSNAKWREDETVRRLNFPKHKVAAIYKIDDDELEIIAVAAFHTLSNPENVELLINNRLSELQSV